MRRATFASGLAVVLALSFVSRARADQAPVSPLATVRAPSASPRLELPLSLRLSSWRELGLAGANLRLRFPVPLATYVDAWLGDGVSASRPDGALMIPGTPIGLSGGAGVGVVHARGVDLGVDVHRFRGGYVSVALGWLRSTWPVGGFDDRDRLVSTDVSRNGFVLKLGFSF